MGTVAMVWMDTTARRQLWRLAGLQWQRRAKMQTTESSETGPPLAMQLRLRRWMRCCQMSMAVVSPGWLQAHSLSVVLLAYATAAVAVQRRWTWAEATKLTRRRVERTTARQTPPSHPPHARAWVAEEGQEMCLLCRHKPCT
jgi:hypothetical protein